MDIPIIEIRGIEEEGVITAKKMLVNHEKLPSSIDTAVIFFDNNPSEELLEDSELFFHFVGASSILNQYIYKNKVVLSYAPLGGPAAGGLVEELIALGVKRFIACGSSGLIGDFDPKDFLLVTKAIRDEGTSYHYLTPSVYVETSSGLNQKIKEYFKKEELSIKEGIAWTTDAFYRETNTRIELRKKQGAVAVEMECASMAAICQFRNVAFSQILYFSDVVKQDHWSGFVEDRKDIKTWINKIVLEMASVI
jgi:uridine phosphorylase